MIVLAAAVLPALLTPNVHAGQHLHYRTTWTRQMHGPALAGSPIVTGVRYTVTVMGVSGGNVSWDRQYTSGSGTLLKFSSDASGQVLDRAGVKAVELPVFVYNSGLLGRPPAELRPGVSWTNTIHHPTSEEFWTSTVEEADPVNGTLRLRLAFEGHGDVGFRGDKYSQEQRETGEAVFVHGILTTLSLRGSETTIYPQRRITEAVAMDTRLEEPGSP